jgi:ABC-type multidrug transport system fused ATPase/permease subunit
MGGDVAGIFNCIIGFVCYILADFALNVWEEDVKFKMIQSATVKMRGDIYHKLMNVDTYYFEGRSSNEYISIIENDVDTVRETYFFLLDTAMELITMLAALVVIWYFCVPIGLFLLVTVLIQAMIPVIFKNKLEKAGAVYSDSKAKYTNLLWEGLSGQFTARVFHVENKLEDRYRKGLWESENGWRKREFTFWLPLRIL